MLRQTLLYVLASFLIIILASQVHMIIAYIDMFYLYVNYKLSPVFNYLGLVGIIRNVLVLTLIPVILTAIPALIYRLIKGETMPHYIAVTWCIWLVIVLSYVLIH